MLTFLMFLVIWRVSVCEKPGIKFRLTEKGIKYVVNAGIPILRNDLLSSVINNDGQSGDLNYQIKNLKILKVDFGEVSFTPIPAAGIRDVVKIKSIEAAGEVSYSYKTVFGITFNDTVGFNVKIIDGGLDLSLEIGSDQDGRPAITLTACSSRIKDVTVTMSGVNAWIYDLINPFVVISLKSSFSELFCSIIQMELKEKLKEKLATLPVIMNVDEWAKINISLTEAPNFTENYMDIFLKGEFLSQHNFSSKSLTIPSITASDQVTKMVYFWITDYTINTAAEVYHQEGAIVGNFNGWNPKTPKDLQRLLQTSTFSLFFPGLLKYPDAQMALSVKSYKAHQVLIERDDIKINLYVEGLFKVREKNMDLIDAFLVNFEIRATAEIFFKQDNIAARISAFDYNAVVVASYVGTNLIPLDSFLVKSLVDMAVITSANSFLEKGLPLNKVDGVALLNPNIKLLKNTIQIESDIQIKREMVEKVESND